MENGHRNSGFSHEKWGFSIAMLVHQRVTNQFLRVATIDSQLGEQLPCPTTGGGRVSPTAAGNATEEDWTERLVRARCVDHFWGLYMDQYGRYEPAIGQGVYDRIRCFFYI